jgi:hypothetical protein
MIDNLRKLAKQNASRDFTGWHRTGWARRGDVFVAYYPRSNRYSYFLHPYGVVNRRDLEDYLARAA